MYHSGDGCIHWYPYKFHHSGFATAILSNNTFIIAAVYIVIVAEEHNNIGNIDVPLVAS